MSMMKFSKEQIAQVAEMTGKDSAKAEKYLIELYKDLEDNSVTFENLLEIVQMECNVKANHVKNVVTSAKKFENKAKKPRTVKISDEKQAFFAEIVEFLEDSGKNYEILKENKLISVQIDEKTFKLDLIEQRAQKK